MSDEAKGVAVWSVSGRALDGAEGVADIQHWPHGQGVQTQGRKMDQGGEVLMSGLEQPSDPIPLATGSFRSLNRLKKKKKCKGNLDSTGKQFQVQGSLPTHCVALGKALRSAVLHLHHQGGSAGARGGRLSVLLCCPAHRTLPRQMSPKVIEIRFKQI